MFDYHLPPPDSTQQENKSTYIPTQVERATRYDDGRASFVEIQKDKSTIVYHMSNGQKPDEKTLDITVVSQYGSAKEMCFTYDDLKRINEAYEYFQDLMKKTNA